MSNNVTLIALKTLEHNGVRIRQGRVFSTSTADAEHFTKHGLASVSQNLPSTPKSRKNEAN